MNTNGTWRKSTYSGANGNCVEFRKLATGDVEVRNSRFPDGARDGEFDDLAR